MQRGGLYKMGSKKIVSLGLLGIACIVVLIIIFSAWYSVGETEQAVVITFGKPTSVVGAGLHFKLPYPIQKIKKVEVNRTQKLLLGYREEEVKGGGVDSITIPSEAKMITGDYNIVNVDFFCEWKISDPIKYLYKARDPEMILKDIIQAAARSIVGVSRVDSVLTTGKSQIQAAIKELAIEDLKKYDIGIQILDIKIQDAEPPTFEVKAAIEEVETAKQQKETSINEANRYKNSELPKAQAEADKIIRNAESYKETRINEAKGQVARFNEMYNEYVKNKDITKARMYYEMLEEVLPDIEVYIDSDGSLNKLLPLKPIN